MEVKCHNPKLIINPAFFRYRSSIKSCVILGCIRFIHPGTVSNFNNKDYIYRTELNNLRKTLTPKQADSCWFVMNNGDHIPMFMNCPCGKCSICLSESSRRWSERAAFESLSHPNSPYFVTLTYNDSNLPYNGVSKEDLQLFMKRLRINLNRLLSYNVSIRFVACGEYGSKKLRPHYHLLIWGIPPSFSPAAFHLLCKISWSDTRSINLRRQLFNNFFLHSSGSYLTQKEFNFSHSTFSHSSDFKPNFTRSFYTDSLKDLENQFGYVYSRKADSGSVKYICKYVRKSFKKPKSYVDVSTGELIEFNDTFFLSSRRPGLGFYSLQNYKVEWLCNPSFNSFDFYEKNTNKFHSVSVCRYYKDKMAPSLATILGYPLFNDIQSFFTYVDILNIIYSSPSCKSITSLFQTHLINLRNQMSDLQSFFLNEIPLYNLNYVKLEVLSRFQWKSVFRYINYPDNKYINIWYRYFRILYHRILYNSKYKSITLQDEKNYLIRLKHRDYILEQLKQTQITDLNLLSYDISKQLQTVLERDDQ